MSENKGIPPDREGDVLARYGEGMSSRDIAKWLLTTFGVDVSHHTVNRLIKEHREERAETTKAIVREKLAPAVVSDVDILTDTQAELVDLKGSLLASMKKPGVEGETVAMFSGPYLQIVDRLIKVTDVKLKYSGAGEPEAGAAPGVIFLPSPATDE